MSFLSKVELKKQLINLGIKVEGNYVRKRDVEKLDKILAENIDIHTMAKEINDLWVSLGNGANLEIATKRAEDFFKAIKDKDYTYLRPILSQKGSNIYRKYFEKLTGIKLPRTMPEISKFLIRWSKDHSPWCSL